VIKLYLGNIPWSATEDDLAGFLREAGFLPDKLMLLPAKDGPGHRGFGFAEFADDQLGRNCVAELNGADFMGRPLNVQLARPKTGPERSRTGRAPDRRDARY
jgi:RNA recognition motif-containing protein